MPIIKTLDTTFFSTWSTHMAYVLGFMYADGNIIKNKRGACFISIYSADRDLLECIQTYLQSNHKLSRRKGARSDNFRIQFGSKVMYEDLLKIGLKPNKTTRMKLPHVPVKFQGDFIRGYFDGDGNVWSGLIHKDRKTSHSTLRAVFTSCSNPFLRSMERLIYQKSGIHGVIRKGLGNYYRLTYSMSGALKLYKIMYNSLQSPLFLKRKKAVFENFIQNRNMRV